MGIVLWHVTMSLGGFIAGPNDAMDWIFRFAGPNLDPSEAIASTGSVLAGRRSYDVGRRPDQRSELREVFGGGWSGPQFVLTHTPPSDETVPSITFLSGDIPAAVASAREAADGKNVLVIGADVARQCVDEHQVDQIVVWLLPILLGAGVRLFDRRGPPIELEPIHVSQSGDVTKLRFRVVD